MAAAAGGVGASTSPWLFAAAHPPHPRSGTKASPAPFCPAFPRSARLSADPLLLEEPDLTDVDPTCKDGFRLVYDKVRKRRFVAKR